MSEFALKISLVVTSVQEIDNDGNQQMSNLPQRLLFCFSALFYFLIRIKIIFQVLGTEFNLSKFQQKKIYYSD